MESGDGLLVRVRPPCTGLSSADLQALARLARSYGNGLIEVTRRANLQLRGVGEGLSALQDELLTLGLAARNLEDETRQLLLVDPLAGLDAACVELAPLARRVEQALSEAPFEQPLSAKLLVVLDAGGPLDVVSDLRFVLHAHTPALASLSIAERPVGTVQVAQIPQLIVRLLQALAEPPFVGMKRMRDVVLNDLLSTLLGHVSLEGPALPPHARAQPLIGAQPRFFGLAIPFGSARAAQWEAIASLAARHGDGSVRFTTKRTLVLPGVREPQVAELTARAHEHGLLTAADHPLLRVTACSGAPACASAYGETRNLARDLSERMLPLLASGATLHVSGCSKSCALGGAANFTLVHDHDGLKLAIDSDVRSTLAQPAHTLQEVQARLLQLVEDSQ